MDEDSTSTSSTRNPDKLQAATFDPTQEELLAARRDLLRWKVLASEYKNQMEQMEADPSWRYTGVIRALPAFRQHWKKLIVLGVLALLSLPLWPVLLLLPLLPAVRARIFSELEKLGLAGELTRNIDKKLSSIGPKPPASPGGSDTESLIFRRPAIEGIDPEALSNTKRAACLLQQLSPAKQAYLNKLGWPLQSASGSSTGTLLSLSSSENRLLRLGASTAASDQQESGTDR